MFYSARVPHIQIKEIWNEAMDGIVKEKTNYYDPL